MSIPDDAILPPTEPDEETTLPATDFTPAGENDVHPAEFIRIDLVPANAQFTSTNPDVPDQFIPNARIIVTNDYAYVFVDGPNTVRSLVGYLTGFTGSNKEGYTAHFPDGSLYFRRSASCACGSRLRGVRPFPYVQFAPLSIF